jgi:serine O-acetyltransferase
LTLLPDTIHSVIDLAQQDERFMEDIQSWWAWRNREPFRLELSLLELMLKYCEFRSLVRYRLDEAGRPPVSFSNLRLANDLYIKTPSIGGGFRIQHGHSTWILAERIGRDFHVNQNVTIGVAKGGKPIIGDRVKILPGAVVSGDITIGNDVTIAPNAFVNFDVPDGRKVFAPRSVIV